MERSAELTRTTRETKIFARLTVDGSGKHDIATGIPFFDHMLTLFAVHGFFDLELRAEGDIEVDFHHTVEDVGIVLGEVLSAALGDKKGIVRYGYAVTPMDDALSAVAVDLSGRPYLIYRLCESIQPATGFNVHLAKEFFRAVANSAKMNLHVNVAYGENDHHVTESIFKSFARALSQATAQDPRISDVRSSKGLL